MTGKKIFLVLLGVIFLTYFILRIPGLTLQPVFCDEAIYIHWAQEISENLRLNAFIPLTDGKTPLFMWLTAPLLGIFSDPLFAGRILSVLSGLATVTGAVVLGKRFFNIRVGLISAFLLSAVPFTIFFDKLALVDSMLAAFSLWSLILALNLAQKLSVKNILLLGFTLGGGMLVKTTGIFSFVTLPIAILSVKFRKVGIKGVLRTIAGLSVGSGVGFGIYNLLRFSPDFVNLSSRNQDYYFPFARLLETPLDPFIGHARDLADWLPKLITWPILILTAISVILIVCRRNLVSLVIFLWGLTPLLVMMLLLKTFTARYILFCVVPMIFLAGWVIDTLYSLLPFKRKAVPLVVMIILLLIPAFSFDYYLMTNPREAPLPREERHGYFEDWTAGYGLKEIAGILKEQAGSQKILVVTEGSFGTLPDGLDIFLKNDPNIEIWYSTSILDSDVYAAAYFEPTYFVVDKSRLAFNKNLTLLNEYPRALEPGLTQDALILYRVLP